MKKKITFAGIGIAALGAAFAAVVAYYYWTTPLRAVVVSADDFPAGLSPGFTTNALIDHVVTHLRDLNAIADSNSVNDMARQEGLGPRAIKEADIPIRVFSDGPSPVFRQKFRGLSFDFGRRIGLTLKAKRFLELETMGVPQSGWQLAAVVKDRPLFSPRAAGNAPVAGGSCHDLDHCASDLAEPIEESLDPDRLLSFYIKTDTKETSLKILKMYQNKTLEATDPSDLIAWGNAFYGLGQFEQALQKYQEAVQKDDKSCAGLLARGYFYFSEPRRSQLLADLGLAESDFRKAIACDPKNAIAHNNLCSTLLREWTNSLNPNAHLLIEANQECEKALEINSQFVVAAVNIGYILYRQGEHEKALRYFETLSQKYPTDSGLFVNYGYSEYLEYLAGNSDALKQAIIQTLQSWKLSQNTDRMVNNLIVPLGAANNLGYFYYEQDDFTQAVDFWKKANALNTDTEDPDCIAGLALGTYKLGDPQTAITLLSKAIRIDPHYRNPSYLRENNSWSPRAASDLAQLIEQLPPIGAGGH